MSIPKFARSAGLAALCCVAAMGALAQGVQSVSSGAPSLVTKPVWVESLRTDYLNEFYPDQTRKLNISGYAIVECQVTDTGAFRDCGLVAEDPKREGFGVALLKIPRFLKIGPVDETGQRTVSRPIRLAAQFGRLKDKFDEDGRPAFGLNLYVTGD